MPDDRLPDARATSGLSGDWSAAFAALPLEAPPSDGWQRIAGRLPATRRTRWPLWLAAAAALALVAVLPMEWTAPDAVIVPPPAGLADRVVPSDSMAAATAAVPPPDASEPVAEVSASDNPTKRARGNDAPTAVARTETARAAPSNAGRNAIRRVAIADTVAPDADFVADAASGPVHAPAMAATASIAHTSELDRLYTESAQLEALLALARDDRVASGTAAALGDAFDARVAGIDADLAQSDLDAARRTALWRERVDAMRQLASFESTQRLLAARGERYDALLVSVD